VLSGAVQNDLRNKKHAHDVHRRRARRRQIGRGDACFVSREALSF